MNRLILIALQLKILQAKKMKKSKILALKLLKMEMNRLLKSKKILCLKLTVKEELDLNLLKNSKKY